MCIVLVYIHISYKWCYTQKELRLYTSITTDRLFYHIVDALIITRPQLEFSS